MLSIWNAISRHAGRVRLLLIVSSGPNAASRRPMYRNGYLRQRSTDILNSPVELPRVDEQR